MKCRSDKEIIISKIKSGVDWVNGESDWIDLSEFWAIIPATWPSNGSVLFQHDRGFGENFLIAKLALRDLPAEEQEILLAKWRTFVATLPESLHESLLGKDWRTSTVRLKLIGDAPEGAKRKRVPAKLKRELSETREHKCVFCPTWAEDLKIDHKDPRDAFRSDLTVENLQYACGPCNTKKRTALRLHFAGITALTPEKLAYWYDPLAAESQRKNAADHISVVSSVQLAADDAASSVDGGYSRGAAAQETI